MKQALISEYRKLFTVRSTYVLSAVAIILLALGSFLGSGFLTKSYDMYYLAGNILSTASSISFFLGIMAALLMAHEYRYNTIVYTLTLNRSRTRVLLAKFIVVLLFSIFAAAVTFFLSLGLAILGAQLAGHTIPAQDFNLLAYLAKSIFYCSGFAVAALLITTLIRNITASIALVFLLPTAIESLFGVLLKHNSIYLPFQSLQSLLVPPGNVTAGAELLSPSKGAIVFVLYMILGWIIAWWLFINRDANQGS